MCWDVRPFKNKTGALLEFAGKKAKYFLKQSQRDVNL